MANDGAGNLAVLPPKTVGRAVVSGVACPGATNSCACTDATGKTPTLIIGSNKPVAKQT